jgi:dienelactone hydrolase
MKKLLFISALLLSLTCIAQKQYRVMDWKTENTLNTYLVQQMLAQYDERMMAFEQALSSRRSLLAYAQSVREKFRTLVGTLPPAGPLNAPVTGKIRGDGYTIEKIVYESFPNHHVTANLYVPTAKKGPFPSVLMFCGHEDVSKATESYQRTAILLAKEGFAVMMIDPISQSERHQLTDANGKPLTRGGTTEHTLVNETANLVGTSAAAYELWDNVRGLDYLVTRPEVDVNKIGCLGNSGGAMQAIYFAAFDPRIKVIVPCSYFASRERTLELSGPADGCAQIPGEGKMQLEMADYLVAAAPKPVLVLAGRYDFIDYNSVLFAFNDLKRAYDVLGEPGKAQIYVYDDGHGISQPKREAAVSWFKRWFTAEAPTTTEPPFAIRTDKDLFATKKGQVNAEYPNEVTVFDRNRMLADSLAASRSAFLQQPNVIDKIKAFLAVNESNERLEANIDEEDVLLNGQRYLKAIVRRFEEPPFPVLVTPATTQAKKIVLWLHDGGKQVIIDSPGLVKSYLAQGARVMVCDVRGTGETADKPELNDPKYFNREYRNAMLALHNGRPLPIQRMVDIMSAVTVVADYAGKLPVEVHASGPVALAALHAALLDKRITQLYLYNTITSFNQILENPTRKDWYSCVIPNVLKYYDVPDLVKLIGEDKVRFVR